MEPFRERVLSRPGETGYARRIGGDACNVHSRTLPRSEEKGALACVGAVQGGWKRKVCWDGYGWDRAGGTVHFSGSGAEPNTSRMRKGRMREKQGVHGRKGFCVHRRVHQERSSGSRTGIAKERWDNPLAKQQRREKMQSIIITETRSKGAS